MNIKINAVIYDSKGNAIAQGTVEYERYIFEEDIKRGKFGLSGPVLTIATPNNLKKEGVYTIRLEGYEDNV